MAQHVVVVGGGAVGTVVCDALVRAGLDVTWVVRERQRAGAETGVWLHEHQQDPRRVSVKRVVTTVNDAVNHVGAPVSQLFLCVAGHAIDDDLLAAVSAVHGSPLIVDASADDRSLARARFGDRCVEMSVPFIAYATPLAGVAAEAARAPGIALWWPPLGAAPCAGPRAAEVADVLKRGQRRAWSTRSGASKLKPLLIAMVNATVAELQTCDFDFAATRPSAAVAQAVRATGQRGALAFVMCMALHPLLLRLGLRLLPHLVPIPIRAYCRSHFTKLTPQTHTSLDRLVENAEKLRVPHHELGVLTRRLKDHVLAS